MSGESYEPTTEEVIVENEENSYENDLNDFENEKGERDVENKEGIEKGEEIDKDEIFDPLKYVEDKRGPGDWKLDYSETAYEFRDGQMFDKNTGESITEMIRNNPDLTQDQKDRHEDLLMHMQSGDKDPYLGMDYSIKSGDIVTNYTLMFILNPDGSIESGVYKMSTEKEKEDKEEKSKDGNLEGVDISENELDENDLDKEEESEEFEDEYLNLENIIDAQTDVGVEESLDNTEEVGVDGIEDVNVHSVQESENVIVGKVQETEGAVDSINEKIENEFKAEKSLENDDFDKNINNSDEMHVHLSRIEESEKSREHAEIDKEEVDVGTEESKTNESIEQGINNEEVVQSNQTESKAKSEESKEIPLEERIEKLFQEETPKDSVSGEIKNDLHENKSQGEKEKEKVEVAKTVISEKESMVKPIDVKAVHKNEEKITHIKNEKTNDLSVKKVEKVDSAISKIREGVKSVQKEIIKLHTEKQEQKQEKRVENKIQTEKVEQSAKSTENITIKNNTQERPITRNESAVNNVNQKQETKLSGHDIIMRALGINVRSSEVGVDMTNPIERDLTRSSQNDNNQIEDDKDRRVGNNNSVNGISLKIRA